MLDVRYYGDPVLRKTAADVEVFGEDIAKLAEDMIETMRGEDGVGLAAPQVGVPIRMFVVDVTEGEEPPVVAVNPEFAYLSDEKEADDEGCLSLPEISIKVNRSARVTLKARDAKGEPFTIENADGLLARALQHEFDHLNGILLIDHVSSVQRGLLRGKLKKITEYARGES